MTRPVFNAKRPGKIFSGLFAFLYLLTVSACGSGNSAQVYDNARVLNAAQVRNAASNLPNPVAIYTTDTFQGSQAEFQRATRQKLHGNQNMIVMAIDTTHRYVYIVHGSNVPLSGTGISQAVNAFSTNFQGGNYTNASLAALNSMQNSLGTPGTAGNRGGFLVSPFWLCCALPLLLILGAILFAASRRRQRREMVDRGLYGQQAMPYGPAPDQGPYFNPPNQGGPYYGPPRQGGINPWMAGGLGAAAGGLAGYELGRRQGEPDQQSNVNYDDLNAPGGGGNFGGGPGSGDFGGGGNFGDAFGAGGNFGESDAGGGGSFGSDFSQGDDAGGGNF